MPRINRTNDIEYTIILISNPKEKVKMLDITTSSNFRNYKWSVENAIKNNTKKTNKILIEIRKYEPTDFKYEKLDCYFGKYNDALKKLNDVADKLGLESNYSVSKDVIELRNKLIKVEEPKDQPPTELLKSAILTPKEIIIDTPTELKSTILTPKDTDPKQTGKVKCDKCGIFVLKSNLSRHIKNKHTVKE
jgi:hypothetical protein